MAAAAHLPPKHQPAGYNEARVQAGNRLAHNRHGDVGVHRSPVLPSGKENIMLPPIGDGRSGRGSHVSASRQDPISNLRNNGAAIMGNPSQHNSARNLNQYRSGSRNGSDRVRDSINCGKSNNYGYKNQGAAGMRPYVKGACYNVDL